MFDVDVPRDPLDVGAVVIFNAEGVKDAGCDGDSGIGIVLSHPNDHNVGVQPLAVIGGEDGHVDGYTPLPWPDLGKEGSYTVCLRSEVKPLTSRRARELRASLRRHRDAGNADDQVLMLIDLLEVAALGAAA